jgi:Tol biopolymer transport system component/predicted Ser/Thr protein kinase
MPSLPGERLGPYEILSPLGAGGMGEVYSARDTRLGRTVAIKRTQARFSDRFQREARAISALNHPNICQLYDVGPDYLVMELVDGSPVAAVETPRKLIDLSVQMADGLSAAHAAGIVHRDLKPDNILVTRDGRVKILDFGLATERGARGSSAEETVLATGTAPGTILGTVAYMSPEQARGEAPLTPQSDQFALGLILYELAAGRRAFDRASTAETMTAIIREDPDPLPAATPAPLRWVIERLLAKDPADRYDSTRDLHRELRLIRDRSSDATGTMTATAEAARVRRRWGPGAALAAGVLAGVIGGAATAWLSFRGAPSGAVADLSGLTFKPIATEAVLEDEPSWSPDGKSIAYVAIVNGLPQVFTRSVGSVEAAQITRNTTAAGGPSWSPDGSAIYFSSAGGLWIVGSAGGAPDRVFERAGRYALHPDGKTIVFQRAGRVWTGTRGDEPREFTHTTQIPGPRRLIGFSPDGSRLAVLAGDQVWVLPYPAGAPPQHHAIAAVQAASWMPDSRRLVLTRIVGPEAHTLSMLDTVTGDHRVFYVSPEAMTSAAVSRDGKRLAYVAGRIQWNIVEVSTLDGGVRTLHASGDISYHPAWTLGGARYVFARYRGGGWGVEEASVADGVSRRLLEVESFSVGSVQSAPDGSQLTFLAGGRGSERLMLANRSGRTSPLDPGAPGPTSDALWSPDGRSVIYVRTIAGQRFELARIRPGSTAAPDILATYPASDTARARFPVAWSPDGTAILTRSGGATPQRFVSTADFTSERALPSQRLCGGAMGFSKDGRAVLALCRNTSVAGAPWQLWSVDVSTGAERLVGNVDLSVPALIAEGFSLHPDGTRFVTSVGIHPYDIWMLEGFPQQ